MYLNRSKKKKSFRLPKTLRYFWGKWILIIILFGVTLGMWSIALYSFSNPFEAILFQRSILATPIEPTQKLDLGTSPGDYCLVGDFQGWDVGSHPLSLVNQGNSSISALNHYSLTLPITKPGYYYWQIIECNNWEVAFPEGLAWVNVTEVNQEITFSFTIDGRALNDKPGFPKKFIVNANDNIGPLTIVGDFQDWINDHPNTTINSPVDGIYQKTIIIQDPGVYSVYLVRTGSWEGFGGNGRSSQPGSFQIKTSQPNEEVHIFFNPLTGVATILSGVAPFLKWTAWSGGFLILAVTLLLTSVIPFSFFAILFFTYHQRFWVNSGCPQCQNKELQRIHRKKAHYILLLMDVPYFRFKCKQCHWEGNRIDSNLL